MHNKKYKILKNKEIYYIIQKVKQFDNINRKDKFYMNIEESIGYTFKDKTLLNEALTYISYAHEKGIKNNEKLEFLGDSVLEFISSKYLYNKFPKLKEGELTKVRAQVVCEDSLYEVAKKHNISQYIYKDFLYL